MPKLALIVGEDVRFADADAAQVADLLTYARSLCLPGSLLHFEGESVRFGRDLPGDKCAACGDALGIDALASGLCSSCRYDRLRR